MPIEFTQYRHTDTSRKLQSDSTNQQPQTTLPHRHRLSDRATETKKDGTIRLFAVEVARVELASKQGTQKLSTRLVVV